MGQDPSEQGRENVEGEGDGDDAALLDDRVGTRRVAIDPALLARSRKPHRIPSVEEQTVDELVVDPELLEMSRRPDSSDDEVNPFAPDQNDFETLRHPIEGELEDAKTRIAPEGYEFEEEKTRIAPEGYGLGADGYELEGDKTKIALDVYGLDDLGSDLVPDEFDFQGVGAQTNTLELGPDIDARALPLVNDEFRDEATVLAPIGYSADLEALKGLSTDGDDEATALAKVGQSSSSSQAVASAAEEMSPRSSQELDIRLDDWVTEESLIDVDLPSPSVTEQTNVEKTPFQEPPLQEAPLQEAPLQEAPVIQVSVQQVGQSVEGAPRDLPRRREDDQSSRQATIALGYEVPEVMRQVVPLTRSKAKAAQQVSGEVMPPVQPQSTAFPAPLYSAASDYSDPSGLGASSSGYPEHSSSAPEYIDSESPTGRRGRSALVIAVVVVICVLGGLVIGFYFLGGLDYFHQTPSGNVPASNHVEQRDESEPEVVVPPPGQESPTADAGHSVVSTDASTVTDSDLGVEGLSSSAALPDESILPLTFGEGEYEEVDVDEEALRNIVTVMLQHPTLRFEVIGFVSPSERENPEEAQYISARRARKAVRVIRQYGPTGRRFAARGARPDELPPRGEPRPITVLKVLGR